MQAYGRSHGCRSQVAVAATCTVLWNTQRPLTFIEHMFIVAAISMTEPPISGVAGRRCHRCGCGRWAWWGQSGSVRSTL